MLSFFVRSYKGKSGLYIFIAVKSPLLYSRLIIENRVVFSYAGYEFFYVKQIDSPLFESTQVIKYKQDPSYEFYLFPYQHCFQYERKLYRYFFKYGILYI